MAVRSLYQILEIPTDSSEREIKRAYHNFAKRLHPDKATSPEEVRRLEEEMAVISQAYNTLKDPARRADYDRQLKNARNTGSNGNGSATNGGAQNTPVPDPSGTGERRRGTGGSGMNPDQVRRSSIANKALAKALQLMNANEPKKAIEFLEVAVTNNDQDALAHAKLAEALLLCGRSFTRATQLAEKAMELDPWNVQHRLTLARIYEEAGVSSRALQVYREVLKWDAHNALAAEKVCELGGGSGALSGVPFAGFLGRLFGRKR